MTTPSLFSNQLGSTMSLLSNQFGSKLSLLSTQFGSRVDLVKEKINHFKKSKSLESINFSMKSRRSLVKENVVDETGIRQVVGCLPIDPVNQRFLFVNINDYNWTMPEGNWDQSMGKQKKTAMRETWELAGVKGTITRLIGIFAEKSPTGITAHHYIYELQIRKVKQNFPGQNNCQRRWMTYSEAMVMVKSPFIQDALSLSSLSPLMYPCSQSLEYEKKKNKKNKRKNEYYDAYDEAYGDIYDNDDDDDDDDIEEKAAKDKEKKKNKKKNKKNKDKKKKSNGEEDEEETDGVTIDSRINELVQINDPMMHLHLPQKNNGQIKSDKLR